MHTGVYAPHGGEGSGLVTGYGLSLPNRAVLFGATTADEIVALAELADRSGVFNSVWVGDSLVAKPRLEAVSLLSAIAARTKKVRLGTCCMASMTIRDPILFAIQWASLDLISSGRALLGACIGGAGTGMGAGKQEADIYGVPGKGRVRRMEEQIALFRKFWTEERTTFHGEVYDFEDLAVLPKPYQAPPPIWIATNPKRDGSAKKDEVVDRAMKRVGELADGYMTDAVTVEEFGWRWNRVREYAHMAGRDPEALGSCIHLMVNTNQHNEAGAFDEASSFLRSYYGDVFTEDYLRLWVLSGAPEVVAERIRDYMEAGCQIPIVRFASWNQQEQFERFIEGVAPLLDDLVPMQESKTGPGSAV